MLDQAYLGDENVFVVEVRADYCGQWLAVVSIAFDLLLPDGRVIAFEGSATVAGVGFGVEGAVIQEYARPERALEIKPWIQHRNRPRA